MADRGLGRREHTKKELEEIVEYLEPLLQECGNERVKLENLLEKTQRNLLDLSDSLEFKDYDFGPSEAMAQQVILLRKENKKLKVERNKAVRELKSIKKKLLRLI